MSRTAPNDQFGDNVSLSAKNIRATRNSRKLNWKKLGSFRINKIVSPYAYGLDLPKSMRIHPVFHVSLMEPTPHDPVPGKLQLPPPPIIVNEEEEFEVEEVYDSRTTKSNG